MVYQILLLALGFFFLYKSVHLFIDGSVSLAQKLGISTAIIGITVIAIGTSLPELFVAGFSSYINYPDLGIGNIIGANITTLLLIFGICAVISPIAIQKDTLKKQIPFGFFAIFLLFILANNFNLKSPFLSRLDGFILLIYFLIFIYYSFGSATKNPKNLFFKPIHIHHTIFYIILGIIGLLFGSSLVIYSSLNIATFLGFSSATIGLTIVAIGTTLPELFTSIIATAKKNISLAVGNIFGSVVINISLIMGISSIIKPQPFNIGLNIALFFNLVGFSLVLYFIINKNKWKISRNEGLLLITFYIFYLTIVTII